MTRTSSPDDSEERWKRIGEKCTFTDRRPFALFRRWGELLMRMGKDCDLTGAAETRHSVRTFKVDSCPTTRHSVSLLASSELILTAHNISLGSFCGGPSERVRGASSGRGESLAAKEGDTHHNARKRLARLKSRDIVTREKIREARLVLANEPITQRERERERPHCRTTRLTAVRVAVKFRRPQREAPQQK